MMRNTPVVLWTLLRREYWEHWKHWLGLTLIIQFAGNFLGLILLRLSSPTPTEDKSGWLNVLLGNGNPSVSTKFTLLIANIIMLYYLVQTISRERQDGSILFWRSLPPADTFVIAAKVLTVLYVIPLFMLVFAVAESTLLVLLHTLAYWIKLSMTPLQAWAAFTHVAWAGYLAKVSNQLLSIPLRGLWLAPLVCFLMCCDSWIKRSGSLVGIGALSGLMLAEKLELGHSALSDAVGRQLSFGLSQFGAPRDMLIPLHVDAEGAPELDKAIHVVLGHSMDELVASFALPSFWFGLMFAAAMFLLVVKNRKQMLR